MSPAEESPTRLRRLAVRAVTEGVAIPQEAAALLGVQQEELNALIGASESGIGAMIAEYRFIGQVGQRPHRIVQLFGLLAEYHAQPMQRL